MKKIIEKYSEELYLVFRVLVGFVFLLHGLMKFGVFGSDALTPAAGIFFWAGVFEVIIGPLVILGLATRIVGAIGAVEMVVALITAHFPKGWMPLANGGEAAVLFFAAFLVLVGYGAGKYALDRKFLKAWA